MKKARLSALLSVALVMSFSSCVLKSKYDRLTEDSDTLNKKISSLSKEVELLTKKIDELKTENERLQLRNDDLSDVNRQLVDKNKLLANENNQFRKKSINLETELVKNEEKLSEIESTYRNLTQDLKKEIDAGNVKIEELKGMLKVNVVSSVLFRSGSDEILKGGKEILNKVADSLKEIKDRRIEVQGHTDDRKIYGKLKEIFPSNWELSAARATKVVRYLEERGMNPELLSAAGYSMYHPIASNGTEEGRAKNRRIEIMLFPLFEK